jgi:hypothetical protein
MQLVDHHQRRVRAMLRVALDDNRVNLPTAIRPSDLADVLADTIRPADPATGG